MFRMIEPFVRSMTTESFTSTVNSARRLHRVRSGSDAEAEDVVSHARFDVRADEGAGNVTVLLNVPRSM